MNPRWAFWITSIALFILALDNLIMTMAIPAIAREFGSSIESVQWATSAYTLTYAVLFITGSAIGDRFGRIKTFITGMAIFTFASAWSALAPTITWLIVARGVQGVGAACAAPLLLPILSENISAEKRGRALGARGAIEGTAVALGPMVGGLIIDYLSWHWIFWLNVPLGAALILVARRKLQETYEPTAQFDLVGVIIITFGILALAWTLTNGNSNGWNSTPIVSCALVSVLLIASFFQWEKRAAAPLIPFRYFKSSAFVGLVGASLLMCSGIFGSIFILTQYLQVYLKLSPLEAGLRTLPWTMAPMIVAPIAGMLSDRVDGKKLLIVGLVLQTIAISIMAFTISPDSPYTIVVIPFVLAGTGMGFFFAPYANVMLECVPRSMHARASGISGTVGELGMLLGIAITVAVFAFFGTYDASPKFIVGLKPGLFAGAVMLGFATVFSFAVPSKAHRT